MSNLEHALYLATTYGFRVFPLPAGKKSPPPKRFPERASSDPVKIAEWWWRRPAANIGILMAAPHFAVDLDLKNGKDGVMSLREAAPTTDDFKLAFETLIQKTPTGGNHLIYRSDALLRQTQGELADGIDTRGHRGYVVGAGSRTEDGEYTFEQERAPAPIPLWLADWIGTQADRPVRETTAKEASGVDQERVAGEAQVYLRSLPPAADGRRNGLAYKAACRLRDFGATRAIALELMQDEFQAVPVLDPEEVQQVVNHAYSYAQNDPGVSAPETQFGPLEDEAPATAAALEKPKEETPKAKHPVMFLNDHHAYIVRADCVLWEHHDEDGERTVDFLDIKRFDRLYASKMFLHDGGKKPEPVTELWMKSAKRRTYKGIIFNPGKTQEQSGAWYNRWRGFSFTPPGPDEVLPPQAHDALEAFTEHAFNNVCLRDEALYYWLMGYFAHIVQRPGQKPLTALVFRGEKGVGKNALIDRVGNLFKPHYWVVDNDRFLLGNFNAHMEGTLMFVLDEAYWGGLKGPEGKLKGLITGHSLQIERKYQEVYQSRNLVRVVLMGNESWLVPATEGERRFAVFDVGNGRKQDLKFFEDMRLGMEAGGYRLLLKLLLEWDRSGHNVNAAPNTPGLYHQKVQSLKPLERWWYECLRDEVIVSAEFASESWPVEVDCGLVRDALQRYCSKNDLRKYQPSAEQFGENIRKLCPGIQRMLTGGRLARTWAYRFPDVAVCRESWEKHFNHKVDWEV